MIELLIAPPLLAAIELDRAPSLWVVLALGYIGTGAAIAWHLGRRGHGLGVTASALACWPLLLGLIGRAPSDAELRFDAPPRPGSNTRRIDACIRNLSDALAETVEAGGLINAGQLNKLSDALHDADQRIARVDRLLCEAEAERRLVRDPSVDAAVDTLRRARDHAHRELEAVLAGLLQLRVSLGLFHLAGESEPVRERLAELEARVAALAELSSVELAQVRS